MPLLCFAQDVKYNDTNAQDFFSNGYKEGFKEGYCHQENFCKAPTPQSIPSRRLGENNYKDGYNRGFVDGKAAKTKMRNRTTSRNDLLIKGARDSAPKYNSIDIGDDFDKGYERGQRLQSNYRNNKSSKTKADKVYDRIQKKNRKKLAKNEKKIKFENVLFTTYSKFPWDVKVYTYPSLKSEVKYIIKKERKIGVIEIIDDKWVKVLFSDGENGYIMNTLLERKR